MALGFELYVITSIEVYIGLGSEFSRSSSNGQRRMDHSLA